MRRSPFAVLATAAFAFLAGPIHAQGIINTYAGASHLFTRQIRSGSAVNYCVGLGGVDDRSVSAGSESPSSPYANAVIPVSVTLGGHAVPQVLFQGLAPGYAGLYQVNIVIPNGAPAGDFPWW